MPTIIDSLFLELGVDTSKFSKDEQVALKKIAEFESSTKRAAGNARGKIATVGEAFRDLAKDSRIGSSAAGIDHLATKFKNLGVSIGGDGALGGMARGLGMLLSPAALGAAAIGLLGKSVFDLNKNETDLFATLARNAELTKTSATDLFALGEASRTVGGNPEAVQAAIVQRDTQLAGMSIGVGSAVPQLIGMARLRQFGAHFNNGGFGAGVDEESLFKAVQAFYKKNGRAKTVALTQGYGLMSADEADLAMSKNGWKEFQDTKAKAKAMKTGAGFESVVHESLKSQQGLGESDIQDSVNAAELYGGIQKPMQTIVGLLTDLRAFVSKILNLLTFKAIKEGYHAAVDTVTDKLHDLFPDVFPNATRTKMSKGMQNLMDHGASKDIAAAIMGSLMQESSLDPFAENKGHLGQGQWDKARQAVFAKWAGYPMGSKVVPREKQERDQQLFTLYELQTKYRATANAMLKAKDLLAKTKAFMDGYEQPGDNSLAKRFANAQLAEQLANIHGLVQAASAQSGSVQHNVTSETNIGDIHVHTPATDPASHADAVRKGISDQPLLSHAVQGSVALSTRAMQ